MASDQSLLLLSAPGIGKSEMIARAASDAGLPCRSLLGTQIAPEDVSGIPRIVGERSVFCPPRILLPETNEPFCLFLDELPACAPDIQKAFYSLLMERRIGEYALPLGTWVVAAGNRSQDRALVRSISSALVNRVTILNVIADRSEWLQWARDNGVRSEILAFVMLMPESLMRPVPSTPEPFSTPRSWASLSQSLNLAENAGVLNETTRRALAFGCLTAADAAIFCVMVEGDLDVRSNVLDYVNDPSLLPNSHIALWFIANRIRESVATSRMGEVTPETLNQFLRAVPNEVRFALLIDLVPNWGELGCDAVLLDSLKEATGLR